MTTANETKRANQVALSRCRPFQTETVVLQLLLRDTTSQAALHKKNSLSLATIKHLSCQKQIKTPAKCNMKLFTKNREKVYIWAPSQANLKTSWLGRINCA